MPATSKIVRKRLKQSEIQAVWEKGRVIKKNNPANWRKDDCGAWMHRQRYRNKKSDYGWEINRIEPQGGDDPSNLRPLHWNNSASNRGGPLICVITAKGPANVGIPHNGTGL